jgi:hypothetical protein
MEVTLVEAARYLKVSEKTVRCWVITNKVQGIQKPSPRGPQWFVTIPDGLVEDEEASEESSELEGFRRLVDVLQGRLEAADQELQAKNEQIKELHILLRQAQSALPAPEGRQNSWWRFWRK